MEASIVVVFVFLLSDGCIDTAGTAPLRGGAGDAGRGVEKSDLAVRLNKDAFIVRTPEKRRRNRL